jgi:hypothetical protein
MLLTGTAAHHGGPAAGPVLPWRADVMFRPLVGPIAGMTAEKPIVWFGLRVGPGVMM